jgi:hypothetical protein
MFDRLKRILLFLSDAPCPELDISKFITFFNLDLFFLSLLHFLECLNDLKPGDQKGWLFLQAIILVDIANVINLFIMLLQIFDFDLVNLLFTFDR